MHRPLALALAVAVLSSACSKEKPSADVSPPPAAPSRVEDRAIAAARTLDEDTLKRILLYEQEMLPHTALVLGVAAKGAAAAGGDGMKMGKEMARDERFKQIQQITEAAFAKANITHHDVVGFTVLTGDLYAKELAHAETRRLLAENPAKVEKWKQFDQEAEKLSGGAKWKFLQEHHQHRPLDEATLAFHQEQLAELDAFRAEFAAKHGEELLALLDRYRDAFGEVRTKQMDMVLGR
jgi:hypothetical protein